MISIKSSSLARIARRENLDFEVLTLLDDGPVMAQRELASHLHVSLGRINSCLKSLVARGAVCQVRTDRAKAALRHAYQLTADGAAQHKSLADAYLERKVAEFDRLSAQIESLRRALGQRSEV